MKKHAIQATLNHFASLVVAVAAGSLLAKGELGMGIFIGVIALFHLLLTYLRVGIAWMDGWLGGHSEGRALGLVEGLADRQLNDEWWSEDKAGGLGGTT